MSTTNVKEIRTKVFDYFRKRNLPVPEKWTDERVASFSQTVMNRGSVERHYTRSARLRATSGNVESTVTAPTVTETSRAACQQRAKELLDEIAQEEIERQQNQFKAALL